MFNVKKAAIALLSSSLFCSIETAQICERTPFTMDEVKLAELHFPPDFLWGFAIAEQQNSSEEDLAGSNWTQWAQTNWPDGTPHINGGQRPGKSCDHWNLYKEDIRLMKQDFNVNSFRFSLAWDRIEPQEGVFDYAALQHYSDEVDALLEAGIIPMITLHHFAHPQWFEDKGGFEKEENIALFVRYSQKVFEVLGSRVPFWCTINEPNIYVFQGYLPLNCVFPPGTGSMLDWRGSWQRGVKVLKHLMQAHTETYKALKKMKHGNKAQIGLVHQYLKFEAAGWNPGDRIPGYLLNGFMDSVLEFLKTKKFSYTMRLTCHEEYQAEGDICDFVGLNFYSNPVIRNFDGSCHEGGIMTDMPYPLNAPGFYEAIKDVAQVGVPIYITENGISDKHTTDDWRRELWIKQYLKTLSLALEDGLPVKGYFYWSLTDNFEWNMAFDQHFGLYAVDFESPTKTRTLKDGGRVFADIIKRARAGQLMAHTSDYRPAGAAEGRAAF